MPDSIIENGKRDYIDNNTMKRLRSVLIDYRLHLMFIRKRIKLYRPFHVKWRDFGEMR